MALSKYTNSTNIIKVLSDRPNQDDGLTAAQLKILFDKFPDEMVAFVNDVLTSEIDSNFATKAELADAIFSNVFPEGSITIDYLSDSVSDAIENSARKPVSAIGDNLAMFDTDQNAIKDSGIKGSEVATKILSYNGIDPADTLIGQFWERGDVNPTNDFPVLRMNYRGNKFRFPVNTLFTLVAGIKFIGKIIDAGVSSLTWTTSGLSPEPSIVTFNSSGALRVYSTSATRTNKQTSSPKIDLSFVKEIRITWSGTKLSVESGFAVFDIGVGGSSASGYTLMKGATFVETTDVIDCTSIDLDSVLTVDAISYYGSGTSGFDISVKEIELVGY